MQPKVSVLMTAYNREQYIADAIESVIQSTYENWELLILDDCSKDKTVEIAESYALQDSRIQVIINEKNLGDYNNRNKAASYATGKYLKYLDSDDIIFPWGLQTMVYCMESIPEAVLGISSNNCGNLFLPVKLSPLDAYQSYYFKSQVLTAGPSATIIVRDAFLKAGGFSGKNYIGDTELWLRFAQNYPIVQMPANLIYWRQHEEQQIVEEIKNKNIELARFELDRCLLLDEKCPLPLRQRMMAFQNLKNIKCRNIIILFLKCRFKSALVLSNMFRFGLIDFIRAFKKNETPF